MPRVLVRIDSTAPIEELWRLVQDVQSYPRYMDDVEHTEVLVDRGDGRRDVGWSVALKGSILEWVEREHVDRDRYRVTFEQLDGDLDRFDGHWQLEETLAGTAVELLVEFEIGIPLLADMLNPVAERALRDNALRMLESIGRAAAPR